MHRLQKLLLLSALWLSGCAVSNQAVVNDVSTVVGIKIGYSNYSLQLGLIRHEYTTVPLSNGVPPNLTSQTSSRISPLGTSVVYRKFATGEAANLPTEMAVPLNGDVITGPWQITTLPKLPSP